MSTLNAWVSEENEKENERKYVKWMMLHLDGGGMNAVTESIMIIPQMPFPDPNKEGHSFSYWTIDNDSTEAYNGTLANVTDLYAVWKVNNYTLTFDYGNGTLVSDSLTFNATITYPNMKRVKKFRGWNSSLERMPAYDLVVGEKPPEPGKSNTGAIVGGVVGSLAVIVVVAVVVVILFALHAKKTANGRDDMLRMGISMRRRRRGEARGNRRTVGRRAGENYVVGDRNLDMAAVPDDPASTTTAVGNMICFDALYPEYYRVPSMFDALIEAGLNRKNAQVVADVCKSVGEKAAGAGKLMEGLTEVDAAAIAMYTFEFGPEESERNPYRLISKALIGAGNHDAVRGLLYLVMCALRKLPRYKDRLLYCGVRGGMDMSRYRKGEVVVWPTIASTSPDMKVAKELIEEDTDNEKEDGESDGTNGTLFVIEDAWGYNIQPYSLCPEDGEEVLLEPGRHFQVDSVIESETTIVNLKMLNTPLILPQVFGGGGSN